MFNMFSLLQPRDSNSNPWVAGIVDEDEYSRALCRNCSLVLTLTLAVCSFTLELADLVIERLLGEVNLSLTLPPSNSMP